MLALVASGWAAVALQRRFLLVGPLIAIALTGAGPAGTTSVAPSPSPSVSVADPLGTAKEAILSAYEAEAVYKVDNLVYAAAVGDELEALKLNEPTVVWGTGVIVQFPNAEAIGAEVVILRAPITGERSLCMAEVGEVDDAGLYYARAPAGKTCPPFKAGMPGWVKDDREAGWA